MKGRSSRKNQVSGTTISSMSCLDFVGLGFEAAEVVCWRREAAGATAAFDGAVEQAWAERLGVEPDAIGQQLLDGAARHQEGSRTTSKSWSRSEGSSRLIDLEFLDELAIDAQDSAQEGGLAAGGGRKLGADEVLGDISDVVDLFGDQADAAGAAFGERHNWRG